MSTRIAFIGAGNMGQAMVRALLNAKVVAPSRVTLVDTDARKLSALQRSLRVRTSTELSGAQGADVVVVAVKPQDAQTVLEQVQPYLSDKAVVVSIMAGIPVERLQQQLDHARVVRVMPNTPALVGQGMSVWIAAPEVTGAQKKQVRQILASCGEELEMKSDQMIDVATTISGSGPAYLFAFAEWLQAAGEKHGLTADESELLVQQTLRGATTLLVESEDSATTLREKVTSKKGVTEAALRSMKRDKIGASIQRAVRAAYARAKEMARM